MPDADNTSRVVLYGLPAALLVAAATLGREGEFADPPERRSLPVRWASALGDASYALYLVHPFVLRAGREAILRSGLAPFFGPWGALALMIGLAVPAALVVHHLVERPLTRRARALLDPGPLDQALIVRDEKALDDREPRVPRAPERI